MAEESAETPVVRASDAKTPIPILRNAQMLLERGVEALERDRIEEAIGYLRQTVALDPRSFLGHLGLGIALTKALEIPEAQQALETALRLEPENFYAHLRSAELYQRIGVPTKAREELRAALDFARTTEEKKIARDLLGAERSREPRRAWRPDFSRLLGKGKTSR